MIAEIMIALGALFCAIGVLGVLRMPFFMSRCHAATIVTTLGTMLVMGGVAYYGLRTGEIDYSKNALLVLFAVMFTCPIASHAIMRASFKRNIRPENLVEDHFDEAWKK